MMNKEITTEVFNTLLKAIEAKKVKCKLSLLDDYEIVAECGWNYPNKLFDKIYAEAEKLELEDNLTVCAEFSGSTPILSSDINGGIIKYN